MSKFGRLFWLVLFVIGCLGVLILSQWWLSKDSVEVDFAELSNKELFERGQYYFNHDDDPAGPYDLVQARAAYEALILRDPTDNVAVWYQLGRIDFLEGKFVSALQKFDKQLFYHGDALPNVHYMIGLTHGYKARRDGKAEDWQAAEEGFKTHITFAPTAPWPRVDLAWVYFAQGDYESMKPTLTTGLQHRPNNPWLLNMLGLAYLNTDDKTTALDYFQQAEIAAEQLTTQDWGNAYPGNSPADWAQGLSEFKAAIEKNIALAAE